MTGWIVYEEADAVKNQEYIKMFIIAAAEHNTLLQIVYVRHITKSPDFELYAPSMTFPARQLPDFVINRSRSEKLAKWLEAQKIRVFNPSIVTEICNDKQKTYQFVKTHGISFMHTAYDANSVADWQYPFVIKPSCGHGGNLVRLVQNKSELISSIEEINTTYQEHPGYVLQQCASDIRKDLRVYILGQKVIASVMRSETASDRKTNASIAAAPIDIRSNYSLGNHAALHSLTIEENALVQRILPLLPFDCAGIDFIYDHGHPVFNEIEDAVGSRMLYANSDIDLVRLYMDYIAELMPLFVTCKKTVITIPQSTILQK